MARLIDSRSKRPVREVRAFEAARCMTLEQAATLEAYLGRTIEVAERIWEKTGPDAWPELRNLFIVRAYLRTGLRRFELAKARIEDARLEGGEFWTVGKGNVKDYVPLTESAVTVLRRWIALKVRAGEDTRPRAFLFHSPRGGPLSLETIRLSWKAVIAAAGLPARFGIHTARHTAGLIVLATTGSLEKTQRFLRHRSIRTTEKFYTHVDAEQLRRDLAGAEVWR